MWDDIKTLWKTDEVHGIEFIFDLILLGLRFLSISYLIRTKLPNPESPNHKWRNNIIDIYCVIQFLILLLLLAYPFGFIWDTLIVSYILFEIYLNLFNIVFIGKIKKINAPPASIERSLFLLLLNVFDVVLAFSVFYRDWLYLSRSDALFQASLVLGTIGYPTSCTGNHTILVPIQILLDLILIVLFVSSFIGRIGLFENKK